MAVLDVLTIVGLSMLASVATEGLNWFFIYRHEWYKDVTAKVARAQKKVDALKAQTVDVKKRGKHEKLLAGAERDLSHVSMQLTRSQLITTVCMAAAFILIYQLMSSAYDGAVVARSPFTPISFLQGISHRGLAGEDYGQIGFAWIYALCSMGLRPVLSKLIGQQGPRMNSVWSQQWDKLQREADRKY